VLHWSRHHGHAHNADQQTSRPWPALLAPPDAPRPSLLPFPTCGPHRMLLDCNGTCSPWEWVSGSVARHPQRESAASRVPQMGGWCEQDVPRYSELRPLNAAATSGDAGWRHSLLPPSTHPWLWHQQNLWLQKGAGVAQLNISYFFPYPDRRFPATLPAVTVSMLTLRGLRSRTSLTRLWSWPTGDLDQTSNLPFRIPGR
jgi:hypothetical protein